MTDVMLPDERGPSLAAALRPQHPSLRVVYLSGFYDHAAFPELPDGRLLVKPFPLDELRRAVAEELETSAVEERSP